MEVSSQVVCLVSPVLSLLLQALHLGLSFMQVAPGLGQLGMAGSHLLPQAFHLQGSCRQSCLCLLLGGGSSPAWRPCVLNTLLC